MRSASGKVSNTVVGRRDSTVDSPCNQQTPVNVEVIDRLSELESISTQWDELSKEVIEPNVFYESWMMIPAWREFALPNEQFIMLIWLDEQKTLLGGMVPLCRDNGYRRIPVKRLTTWKHLHCFSRVPLIRRHYEKEVIAAFLGWLSQFESPTPVISFMDIDHQGPFALALKAHLTDNGEYYDDLDRFSRPMLQTTEDYKSYLLDNFKRKARRNLNHSLNSLKKLGDVRYQKLESDVDSAICEQWLTDFLDLEAAGWKGQEGTALACTENESRFFKALFKEGHTRGQILMLKLTLEERPIAMYVNLLASEPTGFCFKIAYDETLSKFSPGTLLGHETTRLILDELELPWFDSCAQPNHPLFSKLWRQERMIGHVHIGQKGIFAQSLVKGMSLVKEGLSRLS